MTDNSPNCHICDDPLTTDASAVCIRCDRPFHLRLRNDTTHKDCGDVWINEQYLSLEFACFDCLGLTPPADNPAEPPVGSTH